MTDSYAFPHTAADEARRLELLQARLDPITIRRIGQLGSLTGARCLEIGGGRGSMARWLCEHVGDGGSVTVTDLEVGFLGALRLPGLRVLRHDLRTDSFPEGSFDFIHARAVLMHLPERMATLRRIASWLVPGGWLLAEFYKLSMAATAEPLIAAGVITAEEAAGLVSRIDEPDFLACRFAHIGAWGRRAATAV